MKNLEIFFKEVRLNAGAIWFENETIQFAAPKKFQNQEADDFIVNNKGQIISVLKENRIFSIETFFSTVIFKNNLSTHYPLSPAQERLWFIEQYEQGTNAYHIPTILELDVDTNIEGIKYALQQIVSRHEVLRSTIEQGASQEHGFQLVHETPLTIEEITISDEDGCKSLIKEDINRPFDLSNEYPIRVKLYHIQTDNSESEESLNKVVLLINMHHIASDGWSIGIFQKELFAYYEAYIKGDRDFQLPALEIQYKDYAVWQRAYLTGEILEKQLSYWKEKLSGYQNLALPTDYVRPHNIEYRGSYEALIVNKEISKKVRALSQRYGTTLHSVLLSGMNILLGKYTGQDDIVTGSPIANRHHRQTEGVIGFFVNTQVNRSRLNKIQSFEDLILQVHHDQVEAQLYQDLPFEKLIDELGVERDTSRHPVFQVSFEAQSSGSTGKVSDQPQKYSKLFPAGSVYETTKFDLSIHISDCQEYLIGIINYSTSLFHQDSIKRLIQHYTHLLEQLTEAPGKPYSQHSLLPPEEYDQIIYQWNATDKEYPKNNTVYWLFQEQAEKSPGNIALVYEGQELTYKELNEKSNQLARHIRAQYQQRTKDELKPDTLIALFLDRSLEMVIGILAVLKAGGAYVPIDTNYPQERINYILDDTAAELILSQRHLGEGNQMQLPENKVIYIGQAEELYKEEESSNLPQHSKATDLAYVIYTSGTTGTPKGVMVEHGNVTRLFSCTDHQFGFNERDVWTLFHSYVFDFSVWELWGALIHGGILIVIAQEQTKDFESFYQLCRKYKVSVLNQTPSAFYRYAEIAANSSQSGLALRYIIFGGEALNIKQLQSWWSYQTNTGLSAKLINMYGITETTVHVTFKELSEDEVVQSNIGKPLGDLKSYVLDSNNTPVPVGVIGELYIGGAGLARGYLNRPDLTKERFIANPFATQTDNEKGYTRLYKTGDLVRWLPGGNLEFIGRNDNQVKIRGYRIEIGEIEHALARIAGIKQSCVVARERKTETGTNKYLVGYYVPDNYGNRYIQSTILDELTQMLPEYMVPGALIEVETIPLTVNGKIDKQALPDPDLSSSEEYVAPATEMEISMCNIWQSVLGLEKVGITDNFFRIGGNSILAIQVSHRMGNTLGRGIKVADIFRHKTISQLLRHSIGQTQLNIPRTETNQGILSFAQERLWFIEQYEQGTNAYHMPAVLELDVDTNKEGIKYALQQIVSRHEVLRSTIEQGDRQEHGMQRVQDRPLAIEEIIVFDKEDYIPLIKEDINRPFDLSTEYPIRVKFYTLQPDKDVTGNGSCRTLLLINMHHIASDGWSIEIFQKELFAYYEAYIKADENFKLPALAIQYKDYAAWQRTYLTGEILKEQLGYWREKLSGYQTLAFPTDYVRPSQIDYRGSNQGFILNNATSKKLRTLAQRYGTTLHTVLLSSMNILLSKYTGQDDIVTGSAIANRQHRKTEGLIGFFVNMQINRVLLNKTQSFEDLIQQAHHDLIDAQLHQDLPFEKLVDEFGVERDTSRHPVFQVTFVVQSFGNQGKLADQQKMYFKPLLTDNIYDTTRFDLSVFIDDSQEYLMGYINYATSLFNKDTIERFIAHYTNLLEQLVKKPEGPYSQISLLHPEEYNQIIYRWNETDKEYPKDSTVYQLFQEQAEKTPGSIALVYEGQEFTYKELNEKSNQLARYIRKRYQQRTEQELKPDTLIALCLERSLEMIIGMLAVMKAGGAYVPIDPAYPQERINYILEDTKAELVLSQRHLAEDSKSELPRDKATHIDLAEELYNEENTSNLPKHSTATDLAYVMYTSGTTGKPKGVMVEHSGVCNYLRAQNQFLKCPDGRRFYLLHSYAFDTSISCIFGAICFSNTLVITNETNRLSGKIFNLFDIDVAYIPPALLASFDGNDLSSLDRLIVSGELSNAEILKKFSNVGLIINEYGPTEASVGTTYCKMNNNSGVSIIGKSIANKKAYILDPNNNPVPIGVPGELYIGGAGLARGYLNRPELTEERFIRNPFATQAEQENGYTRMYKTGDLVRWLKDGNIEFIGRNDNQVKIRGYRIEIGEIEHALAKIAGIKQSCVLARERKTETGSSKYLAGYYVLDSKYVSTNYSDILDSWENLYNTEYDKDIEEVNRESDFTGWNSYITAEPIPVDEMEQWRDSIVGIVKKLNPGRVLEIGVGTGLLMYPLLGDIERYTGLDISQSVIDRHKNYLEDKKQDVEFYHLRADQVNKLPQEEFYDTIIINSVCQYFPNITYFDDMLDQAMHKLSGAGSIFLGDIRNYDLHKELIKEKLDYAGENYTQQDLERIALKENELLISPGYFINLKSRYKNIRVDIYERTGIYVNELSKYRYDVVISVEGKNTINSTNGIGGNGIALRGYSTNNHNIPFLNQLSREDILKQLSTVLPSYMIPDALVVMESFPLTINGKLDKRALPDPDFSSSGEYMAPTTETEITMCRIWQSVLGLERVGITDNFFRIGGNSILAIQVSHRMSNVSGRDIKVADIFRQKTISELLLHSIGQTQLSIPKTETDPAVLSFAQERLWFIEQYEQGTNAYHMPGIYELDVDTDKDGIKYALQQIVFRHEVLRSTIEQGDNQEHGIQVVHDAPLAIEEITADKDDYKSLVKEDINRPFDLSAEYPIRVKFYTVHPDKDVTGNGSCRTLLLINMHHIASDGWSIEIFQKELFAFYEAYINGDKEFKLPALEIQYKDYAVWQRSYLTGEILEKQLNYWKEKLSGYSTLQFPTDYVRPSQVDYRGTYEGFILTEETSKKLRSIAQRYGTTLHSVLLSSMNILLGKYTGQEDIVTGSPIANRHYRQTEGLIGFFVNTQVNRTLLNKTQNFEDLIQQVHQDQIESQTRQDIPFEKLVDELAIERDVSRHPVFQVSFVVQSFGNQGKFAEQQKKYFKPFHAGSIYEATKFDLSIYIDDSQQVLMGYVNYATSLFHKDTIKRLIQHYSYLLEQLTEAPEKPYSLFSLLRPGEYNQIIYQWNETDKEYPNKKTVYQLFQEQAEKTPGNIALVYEGQQLTYKELNERSNQLARCIRKQYQQRTKEELKPDTLIALCLDRSLEMVIGILAVLKAGGAYVPMDTNYPQDRLNYILEDTRAELVLSQRDLGEGIQIQLQQDKVIYIDLSEELYTKEEATNLPHNCKATDLAYVIYTSGTTGKPKGVMVEQGAISSLVYNDYIKVLPEDVFAFLSSPVFDATTFEIWTPLLKGNRLVIPKDLKGLVSDIYAFKEFIAFNNISILWLTKTLFESIYYFDVRVFKNLNYLLIGGEALDRITVNKLAGSSERPRHFLNGYGPTESTTFTCIYEINSQVEGNHVPIGKPINNRNTYILDANKNPVPIGIIGELYIGGAGLARGYLNGPELTEERFIPNPFATSADILKGYTRLYKTGDLVKWLPDGDIEYIGRNDDQVKIRGYRIELGEIEHVLSKIAGIKQSCVLARERKTETGSSKYLAGYYVLDSKYVSTNYSDILDSWENLYNTEYDKDIEEVNRESDFTGWNSYIKAEPIPVDEMEQWRDSIVGVIRKLNPGRVLEIGVGTGLLMYPLLGDIERYTGLDISQSVIDRHKNYLKDKKQDVEFYHLRADQVNQLPQEEFYDTIIINSVCQYFPNISYFDDMLDQAMHKLSGAGSIFLGDIRNYDLHKELIKEKLDYAGKNYTQQDIDRIALKENELLISPGYFINLKNRYKNIRVDIYERSGIYVNELSKYRYDVVISVEGKSIIKSTNGTGGNGLSARSYSANGHNIPFLNQLSREDILKELSTVLPSYMVPDALVVMASFPLTINGKLDKRALPDPDFSSAGEYVAPTTETEITMCRIWQSLLGLERVGITDNFFRIGGNSILAIHISHRMSKVLHCDVKVADVFKFKNIVELLENISYKKFDDERVKLVF